MSQRPLGRPHTAKAGNDSAVPFLELVSRSAAVLPWLVSADFPTGSSNPTQQRPTNPPALNRQLGHRRDRIWIVVRSGDAVPLVSAVPSLTFASNLRHPSPYDTVAPPDEGVP